MQACMRTCRPHPAAPALTRLEYSRKAYCSSGSAAAGSPRRRLHATAWRCGQHLRRLQEPEHARAGRRMRLCLPGAGSRRTPSLSNGQPPAACGAPYPISSTGRRYLACPRARFKLASAPGTSPVAMAESGAQERRARGRRTAQRCASAPAPSEPLTQICWQQNPRKRLNACACRGGPHLLRVRSTRSITRRHSAGALGKPETN